MNALRIVPVGPGRTLAAVFALARSVEQRGPFAVADVLGP